MTNFKFKLLGMEWAVKNVDATENVFSDGLHGLCVPHETTIYIAEGDSESQKKNTLIHETLHAIEKTLNLDFTEEEIHGLSAGLHECLQNPEWLKRAK